MNCPGQNLCELREHKGYFSCALSGECQNYATAPRVERTPPARRAVGSGLNRVGAVAAYLCIEAVVLVTVVGWWLGA